VIVLIASECSTPLGEVERMPVEVALRYHAAAVRLIEAKSRGAADRS
jgi:hypothetical protein